MGTFLERVSLSFILFCILLASVVLLRSRWSNGVDKTEEEAGWERENVRKSNAIIPISEGFKTIGSMLDKERGDLERLGREIDKLLVLREQRHVRPSAKISKNPYQRAKTGADNRGDDVIPVLVFVCNRADAVEHHLGKLISLRPSKERFPIVVSQDCDDNNTRAIAEKLGKQIHFIKHLSSEAAGVKVPGEHGEYAVYYKIARHYGLGLKHVFEELNHSAVIVTEDDLDISGDFFHYFSATRKLLARDNTLFCVSAWNDNGKKELIDENAAEQLYRSDFFPGLGWMMTRELWVELGKKWPSAFWDDWIRLPSQRKDRQCIRPEVSRTSMTTFGRVGASRGLFYEKHLRRIILNERKLVDFNQISLDYLLNATYFHNFTEHVFSLPSINLEQLFLMTSHPFAAVGEAGAPMKSNYRKEYRVEFGSMDEFVKLALRLNVMADSKVGVPRTAYRGIVTCFLKGIRVYLTMPRGVWKSYDPAWEAPNFVRTEQ